MHFDDGSSHSAMVKHMGFNTLGHAYKGRRVMKRRSNYSGSSTITLLRQMSLYTKLEDATDDLGIN